MTDLARRLIGALSCGDAARLSSSTAGNANAPSEIPPARKSRRETPVSNRNSVELLSALQPHDNSPTITARDVSGRLRFNE